MSESWSGLKETKKHDHLAFFSSCVFACAGERRRKAVCVRKSDHLEVSDTRCERLPRPVAVAEPCNSDCEVRYTLKDTHTHPHN